MSRLTPIALLILLCTCASGGPGGEAEPERADATALTALLAPNEEGLPYPVYGTFEDMSELFARDDDRTYVINFWATWCQPCLQEMPYFERLAAEADPDTEVVLVSLDFRKDIRGKLLNYVRGRPQLPPVIALADADYNAWIDRVDPDWGGAIPVTVVYRGDERRFHAEKFDSYAELKSLVAAVR